ncbi:XRE family transcriptional regulator [Methylovirgula sp. 4M-Z18]|uniref:XRE family transcriptional regulator n=1 Tax=Methylovirgula sp. 4M-Z18 TaxID=2293567 RepID=UPI001FE13DC3|nr:XRE family transcriptional regulator [Methylovirgula sp. 4M-Z18]
MLEEATEIAIKRVIAWKIAEAMKEQKLTKTLMAKRMHTDRSHVNRLLDPANPALTLNTLQRAAAAIDYELRIDLAPKAKPKARKVKAAKIAKAAKAQKAKAA